MREISGETEFYASLFKFLNYFKSLFLLWLKFSQFGPLIGDLDVSAGDRSLPSTGFLLIFNGETEARDCCELESIHSTFSIL